jgi:hypothetical protein
MRALPFALMLAALLPACSGNDSKADRREERREAREARRDRLDDRGGARRNGGGGAARFDANGDGTVTRAEFGGRERRFERLDRNNDGQLSGDELRR